VIVLGRELRATGLKTVRWLGLRLMGAELPLLNLLEARGLKLL